MRKVILFGLMIFLCLPAVVQAASIGGAETQGRGKFAIGLDQEFVFDRDMNFEKRSYEETPGIGIKDAEITYMYRTMLKTSFGLFDGLDVYAKLGMANLDAEDELYWDHGDQSGELYLGKDEFKGKNAFAYGFGVKGTLDLPNGWLVGCDAQYLSHKNRYSGKWMDAGQGDEDTWKGKVTVQEWQVSSYVAKKIGDFVPYVGVKYSDLRAKVVATENAWNKYKADDNFGVFVGTDYKIGEHWKLNLEGRFVDEMAMSFGATYRF